MIDKNRDQFKKSLFGDLTPRGHLPNVKGLELVQHWYEATFYIAPYQDSFASSAVGAAEADAQS